jgi:hypothetical protein
MRSAVSKAHCDARIERAIRHEKSPDSPTLAGVRSPGNAPMRAPARKKCCHSDEAPVEADP